MAYLDGMAGKVHFAMLSRKLRCVSSKDISLLCRPFGARPSSMQAILLRRGALVPLLFRGVFYVRSPRELMALSQPSSPLEMAALACNTRLGAGWHFGLHTALLLNGIAGTQAQAKTFIVTKRQIIPKVRRWRGMEFVFSQIRGLPGGAGIIEKGGIRYSGPARTALDFLHLGLKGGNPSYAGEALDAAIAHNRKGFVSECGSLLRHYSTKKAMGKIIPMRLKGNHAP